ncbi:helix-turn-helix transcriptional regulator [Actinosynnema sp. ALI-1.44]|uniref:helix-turn-helix transcriptional regulator n=1 Tax=Actinosynnema sp. ALI-1.44 TaxID=1933779 RepID=UPI00097BABF8|nr:response regulator transcription factor [Actinosynnema sp. ALI-1.44]ONI87829.1 helix-turn-helix transcriptional regulator [Actinosynnema sp. ALI-1.44]
MRSTQSRRVRVVIEASDPITHASVLSRLEAGDEFTVLSPSDCAEADVVVLAPDRLDADVLFAMRRSASENRKPVVLVIDHISESELLAAVECHAVAIVPRQAATTSRLSRCVSDAAAGGGVMPPDVLEQLLRHVEHVQREMPSPCRNPTAELTSRDTDILRMLARGLDTAQIADELCYTVPTVKNLISSLLVRLTLRNRSQAVAYAIQTGAI